MELLAGPSGVSGTFEEHFHRPPEGTWAAPGRLNLIGEFTDYNDGFVLPMALPLITTATVAIREDDVVSVYSANVNIPDSALASRRLGELRPESTPSWSNYAFGVVWSLRELGLDIPGLDILLDSGVPIGAGLSSSAALECAIGLALRDLIAPAITLPDLALACQRAENIYVGVPSGIMDQTASLCCTAGHAIMFDTRSGEIEQVNFDLLAAGLQLLVIDTRVRHELSNSAYADRRAACERAAAAIGVLALRDATLDDLKKIADPIDRRRARHVITENMRVLEVVELMRANRLRAMGPVLSTAHNSLRDDFEVTCAELDLAAEQSVESGAYGARMIGGGFGGCVIALVERDNSASVEAEVVSAFVKRRFAAPRCFTASPARGAFRVS